MNEAKWQILSFGVKSAMKNRYYVNAMRRLHLFNPWLKNDLPDD